ncbi:ATP-binding protein [Nocardia sp. NPDC055321]
MRRALGAAEPGAEQLVESAAPGYLLRVGPADVDAGQFGELAEAAARASDPRARADLLTRALGLWRGEPFTGIGDPDFARAATARLTEQHLTAAELLAETRLELGEHHALVAELGDLAGRHPLRERLRALQITALYRAGRQSEALAVYTEVRNLLAEELGVDPGPELTGLHRAILSHDESLRAEPAGTRSPGPAPSPPATSPGAPLTDLIGRRDALPAVLELLGRHRLVTLTGLGGVGKTRLAQEIARLTTDDHPDGVHLVGLAGSAGVLEQIGAALGLREERQASLEEALRPRNLLLILDNCEHVIESAAAATRLLLAAAPGLRILATSREPLGLAGEAVWTVPPLSQSDAERLFVLRATAAAPGFTATPAETIAAICRRLDRVPLALELAATRVRALGVDALLDRLDDRFRLLSGGNRAVPQRQRSLWAMIDWSWELLGPDERTVLRSLAVFADGCTLDAAEAVCDRDLDVLGALIRLVDSSVVVTDGARYRLPESIAAYARTRLDEAGGAEVLRRRHLSFHEDLAARSAAELHGPGQRTWSARRDPENADLRAALEFAVRHGAPGTALALALDSTWYWFLRGRLREARRMLAEVLRTSDATADSALHSRITHWHNGFAVLTGAEGERPVAAASAPPAAADARAEWFFGHALLESGVDLARSETTIDRALRTARAAGDRWTVAAALSTGSTQALLRGDLAAARDRAEQAHALFTELGDDWGRLQTTYPLAALASIAGNYATATELHSKGLRLARELGFSSDASDRITGLGRVALLTGDFARAAELHREARALATEHGYTAGEVHADIGLALGARRSGDAELAAELLDRTLAWHRAVEFGPGPALLLAESGFLAEQLGDAATALARHREGLAVARAGADPRAVALALEGLAGAHALAGRPELAARLLGTAARARESVGAPLPAAERTDVDRITDRIRKTLGDTRFAVEIAIDGDDIPDV